MEKLWLYSEIILNDFPNYEHSKLWLSKLVADHKYRVLIGTGKNVSKVSCPQNHSCRALVYLCMRTKGPTKGRSRKDGFNLHWYSAHRLALIVIGQEATNVHPNRTPQDV